MFFATPSHPGACVLISRKCSYIDPTANFQLAQRVNTFLYFVTFTKKISFDFPENGTPTQKSLAVVHAISNGALPADVGQTIISIIKDSVIIEEGTDLKKRIESIEKAMDITNG